VPLIRVISGGQNGVDLAALLAAHAVGLATGGWMPRVWRTLDGPRPSYAARFGLREHPSPAYPPRTHQNVAAADATLRLAVDFDSAGERCTRQGVVKHRKPSLDVPFGPAYGQLVPEATVETTVFWLLHRKVETLNVAGNSERTAPGIGAAACVYLTRVFRTVVDAQHRHG
jgi:hypothetical protein